MALCINKQTNYGVDATYFKIVNLEVSYHFKRVRCEIAGFVNKQARDESKESLTFYIYDFVDDNFTFLPDQNITEAIYNLIKQMEEWKDATDC